MRLGIAFLLLGYVLSQFYRAFLAVLAPMLLADTGAGPDDLALSSGLWFLAFAAMQIPVGWALDTHGPRRTTSLLLAVGGGGGALVFAAAQGPMTLHLAMILIAVGCAPVLMAAYYIFARTYSAAIFATLAGTIIGVGSLGNVAGALPLAWAAETFGWRGTVAGLGIITLGIAAAVYATVQDPPRVASADGQKGSLLDLLRLPALWFILPLLFVNYAPAAGLRGLWLGPFYADVYGAGTAQIGLASLVMAGAMVLGNFAYGPLDRVFHSRKWVVFGGNAMGAACLLTLAAFPLSGFWPTALLFAGIGCFGASFPLLMAHGRSFVPPHLLGRGVTLLNLFVIGGAGAMQLASGAVHRAGPGGVASYQTLLLFFAVPLVVGLTIYLFSTDRTD
ncbi:MFS transporter [Roseicitreum antarcticum]|uniref:Predicted arabinose efflux permease, MFS family n=1 Tax=Roseicitreum antarcticum TaxID=564137 RepID=A0A1H2RKX5_9RHOB|nr:MFS transporter [Roseicitreum antarcticum]SDW20122.1 Predicted arabinose efflux permease, MFS family [Roseicitreum antarcticum]